MKYVLLFLLLSVFGGFLLFMQGFRFNITASMPRGIYQMVPGDPALAHGDLVNVCMSVEPFATLAIERGYLRAGTCPNGSEPLLKTVVGLPGDELAVEPEGILINGQLQPFSQVAAFDSLHRPMPVSLSLTPGQIPGGMALVLSAGHPGGFDGRYFGLVPLASLQKVIPRLMFTPKETVYRKTPTIYSSL